MYQLRRESEKLTQEFTTYVSYKGYSVIGKLEPLKDYILPEANNIHIYEWRMIEWKKWLKKN